MDDLLDRTYESKEELLQDLHAGLLALGYDEPSAAKTVRLLDEFGFVQLRLRMIGREAVVTKPTDPPGVRIGAPIIGQVFVFNGKKALLSLFLTASGEVLDSPVAQFAGILKTLFATDFALVDYESGMACNLAMISGSLTSWESEELTKLTSRRRCWRPKSPCGQRDENGKCMITLDQVERNLLLLCERKAVTQYGGYYSANIL